MKVLLVASEAFPLVKTGGLADVVGALPGALTCQGVEARTLIPGYPSVMAELDAAEVALKFDDLFGGPGQVLARKDLFVLDVPHLFARAGAIYGEGDDVFRFAALAWVAAQIGWGAIGGFSPDAVHSHDWQAGLVAAYLTYSDKRRPGTVFTIHNLAFQGQFPAYLLGALRLPPGAFSVEGVEYYGGIGFLKAGIRLSDRVTTVSPTYADEIRTDAGGMGLAGLLRARGDALSGILNGVDSEVWDPARDAMLAATYDGGSLGSRAVNKAALQKRLGLDEDPGTLLTGVISRLAWQKGMDLLLDALGGMVAAGAQLAVLGAGEPGLEAGFIAAAAGHPGRVGVRLGFDERLAHLIQGGVDLIAVPSRFEPCGLTQLCALRYGAVPLVARAGGLTDTVIDANEVALAAGVGTGFIFSPVSADALGAAIRRAARVYRDQEAWRLLQRNGMASDVSWSRPARSYAALYRTVGGLNPRMDP